MTRHRKQADIIKPCHEKVDGSPSPIEAGMRATTLWFGPHSPLADKAQGQEEGYQFIFFPKI